MDIGDKLVWVVIIGGVLSVLVVGLIKVGEILVKRRTASMIAEHGERNEGEAPSSEE